MTDVTAKAFTAAMELVDHRHTDFTNEGEIRMNPLLVNPNANNTINTITPPAGSSPANILYLKVTYSLSDTGDAFASYNYDTNYSGIYPLGSGIRSFVKNLANIDPQDRLGLLPAASGQGQIPIPVIEDPCYIIFAVDPNGLAHFVTNNAVKTDDDTAAEYFNLNAVQDSNLKYSTVYFRAISPSVNGYYDDVDSFNLYFNIDQESGGAVPGTIDPAIKNTGHDTGGNDQAAMITKALKKKKHLK
jgi:hypothetical protein